MNPTHQQLADLLRQARTSLNDAYLQDQTNAYGKWKVECDAAWLAKGVMLPYSSNVTFPSEKEVIAKALELYNSQNPAPRAPLVQPAPVAAPVVVAAPVSVTETVAPLVQPLVVSEPVITPTAFVEPVAVEEPLQTTEELVPEVTAKSAIPVVAEIINSDETTPGDSEEVQRTSRLRALLNKFMSTATDLESKNIKGNPNDVQ